MAQDTALSRRRHGFESRMRLLEAPAPAGAFSYRPSVRRTIRAVRILARDGALPRWLRGLALLGLAPVPGPFDEAVLLVVAAILWLGYRERLRKAWRDAG